MTLNVLKDDTYMMLTDMDDCTVANFVAGHQSHCYILQITENNRNVKAPVVR